MAMTGHRSPVAIMHLAKADMRVDGATTSERGGVKVGLVNSADFLLVAQYYDGYSRSARMPAIQR